MRALVRRAAKARSLNLAIIMAGDIRRVWELYRVRVAKVVNCETGHREGRGGRGKSEGKNRRNERKLEEQLHTGVLTELG